MQQRRPRRVYDQTRRYSPEVASSRNVVGRAARAANVYSTVQSGDTRLLRYRELIRRGEDGDARLGNWRDGPRLRAPCRRSLAKLIRPGAINKEIRGPPACHRSPRTQQQFDDRPSNTGSWASAVRQDRKPG